MLYFALGFSPQALKLLRILNFLPSELLNIRLRNEYKTNKLAAHWEVRGVCKAKIVNEYITNTVLEHFNIVFS